MAILTNSKLYKLTAWRDNSAKIVLTVGEGSNAANPTYNKSINFRLYEPGKDTLTIDLKTRMADYIIDASTKKVIRGDKFKETYHIYRLTFVKTEKAKAPEGEETDKKDEKSTKTTNCPNCGAPTEITSTGRCPYCHSVITTKEYDWVLDNLERPQ